MNILFKYIKNWQPFCEWDAQLFMIVLRANHTKNTLDQTKKIDVIRRKIYQFYGKKKKLPKVQ